jgi:hypothetical protein
MLNKILFKLYNSNYLLDDGLRGKIARKALHIRLRMIARGH